MFHPISVKLLAIVLLSAHQGALCYSGRPATVTAYKQASVYLQLRAQDPFEYEFAFVKVYETTLLTEHTPEHNFAPFKTHLFRQKSFGGFDIFLPAFSKPVYITVSLVPNRYIAENTTEMPLLYLYLVEPGDSLVVAQQPVLAPRNIFYPLHGNGLSEYYYIGFWPGHELTFKGKGAAKYQCRYEIDQRLMTFPRWEEPVAASMLVCNTPSPGRAQQAEAWRILEYYRAQLSETAYLVFWLDYWLKEISEWYWALHSERRLWRRGPQDDPAERQTIIEHFWLRVSTDTDPDLPSEIYELSRYYTAARISRVSLTHQVSLQQHMPKNSFGYHLLLKEPFHLKEKLITGYLLENYHLLTQRDSIAQHALATGASPVYNAILKAFLSRVQRGSPASAYRLADVAGAIHDAQEDMGKARVILFWTQLDGAKYVYDNLLDKVERMYGPQSVVILAINFFADNNIAMADMKAAQGQLGRTLVLRAANNGLYDPIVKYYNVPTVIFGVLVDRHGHVYRTFTVEDVNPSLLQDIKEMVDR